MSVSVPRGKQAEKRLGDSALGDTSVSLTHRVLRLLATSLILQVSVAFFLVLALKWPVLHLPPVWDTAMSVFPAAITLEKYDFNLSRLLKEPSYADSGPNVHADSLITLITAAVIRLTDKTEIFLPTLHLFHFLITALTLVAVYRYGRHILGDTVSLLSVLAILTFPLFLTQAGYMYLEMPLAFTTMMAFVAWRNGRTVQAGFWAILSLWIKPTGILVGLALTLAAVLSRAPIRERCQRAAIVGLPPLSLALLKAELAHTTLKTQATFSLDALDCIFLEIRRYLMPVPDLALLIGLFLFGCAILYRPIWAGLRHTGKDEPDSVRNQFLALNFLAVFAFLFVLYVVAPLSHQFCAGLPRYYVSILPFIFTTLTYCLSMWLDRKKTALLVILVIGFFILNRNGIFYPSDINPRGLWGNDFAVTERSGGYRELVRLQREAMRFLEKIPPSVPVYFGQHEAYLNKYPAMGYVKSPMANTEDVSNWDIRELQQWLSSPPECAYFLYNYPWLGGHQIQYMVRKLKPTHRLERIRVFRSGEYKIILLRACRRIHISR